MGLDYLRQEEAARGGLGADSLGERVLHAPLHRRCEGEQPVTSLPRTRSGVSLILRGESGDDRPSRRLPIATGGGGDGSVRISAFGAGTITRIRPDVVPVRVPVLSSATARTSARSRRACPERTSRPSGAALPSATWSTSGIARPSAHGEAMSTTDSAA